MNCPRCSGASLREIDRDGVTIDRCESCRGVWLDRGELEKLIARAQGDDQRDRDEDSDADLPRGTRQAKRRDDDDGDDDRRGGRRRSWWDIFD